MFIRAATIFLILAVCGPLLPAQSVTKYTSAIANTSTDGVVAANDTATTAGTTIQRSPRVRLQGAAWDTNGGGSNKAHEWIMEAIPSSGNPTTSKWSLGFQLGGTGGYSEKFSVSNAGQVTVGSLILPTGATATRIPYATATNTWGDSGNFTWDNSNTLLNISSSSGAPRIGFIRGGSYRGVVAVGTGTPTFSNIEAANDMIVRADSGNLILTARNSSGGIKFGTGSTDSAKATIQNDGQFRVGGSAPASAYDTAAESLFNVHGSSYDGGFLASGAAYSSNLTSGRVTFATTNGQLTDSADLAWDGSALTANGQANFSHVSLSGDDVTVSRYDNTLHGATLALQTSLAFSVAQNIVQTSNTLGEIRFRGSNGTNFVDFANIRASVDAAPSTAGSGDYPGALHFQVVANGTASLAEAIKIKNDKEILLGAAYWTGYSNDHLRDASGAHLTAAGVWSNGSSQDYKFLDGAMDGAQALAAFQALPVYNWEAKVQEERILTKDGQSLTRHEAEEAVAGQVVTLPDSSTRPMTVEDITSRTETVRIDERSGEKHIGPVAEDWKEITGLGDGKSIAASDETALLMAAMQHHVERTDARLTALEGTQEASGAQRPAPGTGTLLVSKSHSAPEMEWRKVDLGSEERVPAEAVEEIDETREEVQTRSISEKKIDYGTMKLVTVTRKECVKVKVPTGKRIKQLRAGWELRVDGLYRKVEIGEKIVSALVPGDRASVRP